MSIQGRFTQLLTLLVGCALLPASAFAQLSFQPSQPAQLSNSAKIVFHGDFNNDGREDLIGAGYETSAPYTFIDQLYLSNGNGTYQAPITLPALAQAIGDFNQDGKLDFAAVSNSGAISVYLGNGDGTFQAPRTTPGVNEVPTSIISADLNHDGKTDLVQFYPGNGNGSPATLQLFISNGDGTFTKGQTIVAGTGTLAGQGANYAVTGDFDGDGKPDIALLYGFIYESSIGQDISQPTTVQVFYGDGAGHLGSPVLTTDANKYYDIAPIVADVNNDGRSDIVTADAGGNGRFIPVLSIFTGNSNRTLSYSTLSTNQCAGIGGEGITVADFNGDGLNDLAYQESPCDTSSNVTDLAIRLGTGAGKFGSEDVVYQNLNQTGAPYAVRTTLGTKPDIVFSQSLGGAAGAIELLTNTSSGNFPACGLSGFAEGVEICTPGATASSPVKFSVGAAGPTPMRTAAVWADGKKVAEQLTHAFSNYSFLDASVPLAAGSHAITVYGTGWDNTLQEKSFTLTVGGGGACSAPSSPGVNVCSPVNGSTVNSPVTVQASSTVSGTIQRMEVWVDGVKKYTAESSTVLNTSISLGAGKHRFDFYAVNTAGQKWEQTVYATVGSGGACAAPSSPGVNVCLPANGSTVSSPVTAQAASDVTGTIQRMEVWVDGVKKYTAESSTVLNTSISLGAGSHRFDFYAVNTAGQKWVKTVYASVK